MSQQHTILTNLNSHVSKPGMEAFHKRLQKLYPCVEDVTKLPHAWAQESKAQPLGLTTDKLGCYYRTRELNRNGDKLSAAAVRTDHFIPPSCLLYYYEIKCNSMGCGGVMGLGLTSAQVELEKLPGWSKESYGYHADDGNIFVGDGRGHTYGPKFEQNDVIGCGYNLVEGKCFFTRNGLNLGKAFESIPANLKLYPSVGLKTYGEEIQANFGQQDFVYDIEQDLRSLRKNMTLTISDYPISDFNSWQTSLHKLVQSWLIENSYPETAEAFSRATKLECKENLQRVQQRSQIQQSVLRGRISEAIRLTDRLCPNLLKNNPNLLFALKCRQFIELISGAEIDYQPIFTYANTDSNTSASSIATTTDNNTYANGGGSIKSSTAAAAPLLETAGDCDQQHLANKNNGCTNGSTIGANNNNNNINPDTSATSQRVKTDNHQPAPPPPLLLTSSSSSSQDLMDVDQPTYSNNHRSHNGSNNNHTATTTNSQMQPPIPSSSSSSTITATATSMNPKLTESNGNAQNITHDSNSKQTTEFIQAKSDPDLDANEEKYIRLIQFGRELSEYLQQLNIFLGEKDLERKRTNEQMLQNTIGLIAFTDPRSSQFGKLLDPREREPISQLLNNSIVKAEKDTTYRQPLERVVDHLQKTIKLNNSYGKWLVDKLIEQQTN